MAKNRTINVVYKVNKKEIDAASASTKKIQGETQKFKKELKETESVGTKAFNAIGAAIVAIGFGALVKDILRLGAAQQQLNIAFTTFLGDANKAKKLIAELTKFSIVTPFTPEQVNKAAKSLLAFGVQAKDIIKTLKFLGDVSAGTGKDLSEMAIIFGQIRSTGRLMGQDLLQLINAGFNPLQIIAEKTGKSVADLKKEMEKGLVSFKDVEDAFISATSAGGLFFNLMEKQSQSIAGKWSTIMGNIEEAGKELFNSNVLLVDLLVTKLNEYTSAFLDVLKVANSDPIFIRATKNVESFTTALDENGDSIDKIDNALNKIATSGNTDDLNKLYRELTEGINEYRLSLEFLKEEQEKTNNTDEFLRLRQVAKSEEETLRQLIEIRDKLQKDAVTANVKFELESQAKLDEMNRSAVDEQLTIFSDYYKLRDDLQKKNEKQFQDILEESNKIQEGKIKDQYDWEFNELARKNDREVKEIDRTNAEKKRLEEQHQEDMRALKLQAFNYGVDLLGQALFAATETSTREADAIQAGYDRQIEAAGDNSRRINEIRIEQDAAARESAITQAKLDQQKQIKQMIIQNLLNALRALGTPPVPNFPLAALTAGYGVASIGIAKSLGFKEGVIDLQGPGTETSDSINARLSKHESVMTAAETRRSMGILKDIRAKKLDDKIFEKLKVNGGSVVANLDDRRIVSAIEKSRVNFSREGTTLYEHHKVSDTFTRKIRAKIINR